MLTNLAHNEFCPQQADAIHIAGRDGFRQVWLTGVHLGSYGRDLQPRRSLLDLNNQIQSDRADAAKLRGTQEQLVRDLTGALKQIDGVQRTLSLTEAEQAHGENDTITFDKLIPDELTDEALAKAKV